MKTSKDIITAFFICCAIGFFSCRSNDKAAHVKASNALDAAHEFLSALLKGEQQKAAAYMIDDAENYAYLKTQIQQLKNKGTDDRDGYATASIIFGNDDVEEVSPTETIIHYKNSYDRVSRKLKIIQQKDEWLVDFKYTFNPNL